MTPEITVGSLWQRKRDRVVIEILHAPRRLYPSRSTLFVEFRRKAYPFHRLYPRQVRSVEKFLEICVKPESLA